MLNALLNFTFALTGSRAVSELIGKRRMMARWNAAQAAHLNAGGYVVTIERKGEGVETRLM
jgi:hypothetical protein